MVSSWDCCWRCSCSAIVDAGATRSVLFVGGVLRVAAVWVSFKSVLVFPDSYCQSASSVSVSQRQQWPSNCAVQWLQVVSRLKKRERLCVDILKSHKIPAVDLHWDTTEILISQLLRGRVKQCKFSSESMRSAAVTQAFVPVENV